MKLTALLITALILVACEKGVDQDIKYNTLHTASFTTPSGKAGNWSFVVQTNFGTETGNKYVQVDFGTVQHGQATFNFTSPAGPFSVQMPGDKQKRLFLIGTAVQGTPTLANIIE